MVRNGHEVENPFSGVAETWPPLSEKDKQRILDDRVEFKQFMPRFLNLYARTEAVVQSAGQPEYSYGDNYNFKRIVSRPIFVENENGDSSAVTFAVSSTRRWVLGNRQPTSIAWWRASFDEPESIPLDPTFLSIDRRLGREAIRTRIGSVQACLKEFGALLSLAEVQLKLK